MVLGPVGPAFKTFLTRAGYELYRPTDFERSLIRSPFADWFSKDIALFSAIYKSNREILAHIPKWVRHEDLASSFWRYGVPEQWNGGRQGLGKTGLNEIEVEPTYSDLIAFICYHIPRARYLEIGVSVGKNFLQICRSVPGDFFVGLDVERLNPVLGEALGGTFIEHKVGPTQTVETLSGVCNTVALATYTSGNVTYLRGDQFSRDTWATLSGKRFNFIFSDGVHSAKALRREMKFLLAEKLIDTSGPFAMYWDDLVNIEMQSAFNDCAEQLRELFGGGWCGLHWIHGTYGHRRLNGLFTNLKI